MNWKNIYFIGKYFKVSTSGPAYNATLNLTKLINVQQNGQYQVSFYTFFNCPKTACENTDDKITIKILNNLNYINIYTSGKNDNRYLDNKWKRDIIDVDLVVPTAQVKHIEKRKNKINFYCQISVIYRIL